MFLSVQKKLETHPPIGSFGALKVVQKKWNKIEKVRVHQSGGVKNSKKNQPPNITKANSSTPKKFLIRSFACSYSSKMIYRTLGGTLITL